MIRNCSLEEISDGRLYDINDMVKADCKDCKGCSACCKGMGNSIVLDPYDMYRLTTQLDITFEGLMAEAIELNVVDGIVLPNLKMSGSDERCHFLNSEGRCSIHSSRPGICRLFPLGRYYENDDFKYILQVNECKKTDRTKVKVKKWIDTPNIAENKRFVLSWHKYLKDMQEKVAGCTDDEMIKQISMSTLVKFYITPYDREKDFYEQFYSRLNDK